MWTRRFIKARLWILPLIPPTHETLHIYNTRNRLNVWFGEQTLSRVYSITHNASVAEWLSTTSILSGHSSSHMPITPQNKVKPALKTHLISFRCPTSDNIKAAIPCEDFRLCSERMKGRASKYHGSEIRQSSHHAPSLTSLPLLTHLSMTPISSRCHNIWHKRLLAWMCHAFYTRPSWQNNSQDGSF